MSPRCANRITHGRTMRWTPDGKALIVTLPILGRSMNTPESPPTGARLFALPASRPPEQIQFTNDARSGMRCVIVIDSTARGPAFGGCRFAAYADDQSALKDALRLARGMSMKNALANLPFGGGKAVILRPRAPHDRRELFAAYGHAVASAGGRYITAEDVGSTAADMLVVQRETAFVSGIPRDGAFGGDPSPSTALGVFIAIEETLQRRQHTVRDSTIAIQGLGAVGMALAERLHDAGARLVVADIDAARTAEAAARLDATVVDADRILFEPCDVLAPCALGAVLDAESIPRLRAAIVCGAANNQLAEAQDGDLLHARGVLYLPDFVVNAGGVISVAREYLGVRDRSDVAREIALIGQRVHDLLDRCGHSSPARTADAWALDRLNEAAAGGPPNGYPMPYRSASTHAGCPPAEHAVA